MHIMKNNILRLSIVCFFLINDFMMFSQPGDESDTGDLEDNDTPQAPINGKLIFLAIAGIIFAIYTFRNYRKRIQ